MSKHRNLRVADLIKRELSDILVKKIRDPRLNSIIIQNVEVSADLRRAKIYYSRINQDVEEADITAGLNSAMGFFRRHLSRELNLRYTPELIFYQDHTQEYRDRIELLLHEIKDE
jgi:ribosome-binding factor A